MASMPYFNPEQRHYKKDTRFLLDLYTITYDNHESVDNICCLVSIFYFVIICAIADNSSDLSIFVITIKQKDDKLEMEHAFVLALNVNNDRIDRMGTTARLPTVFITIFVFMFVTYNYT